MKKIVMSLLMIMFLFVGTAFAGDKVIEFSWEKDTIEDDLMGFVLYQGDAPMTVKTDAIATFDIPYVPGQDTFIYDGSISCPDGTLCVYYFRIDAYDTSGNNSSWSVEEPSVSIDFEAPTEPTQFKAIIKIITP